MITHIVCWKIKEPKSENLVKMKSMLEALTGKVREIKDLEVGLNYNDSPAAFDISLYSTFDSKDDLAAYQKHPEHVKVGEFIKQVTDERVVVDYEK